jgi:hypothetical protein
MYMFEQGLLHQNPVHVILCELICLHMTMLSSSKATPFEAEARLNNI